MENLKKCGLLFCRIADPVDIFATEVNSTEFSHLGVYYATSQHSSVPQINVILPSSEFFSHSKELSLETLKQSPKVHSIYTREFTPEKITDQNNAKNLMLNFKLLAVLISQKKEDYFKVPNSEKLKRIFGLELSYNYSFSADFINEILSDLNLSDYIFKPFYHDTYHFNITNQEESKFDIFKFIANLMKATDNFKLKTIDSYLSKELHLFGPIIKIKTILNFNSQFELSIKDIDESNKNFEQFMNQFVKMILTNEQFSKNIINGMNKKRIENISEQFLSQTLIVQFSNFISMFIEEINFIITTKNINYRNISELVQEVKRVSVQIGDTLGDGKINIPDLAVFKEETVNHKSLISNSTNRLVKLGNVTNVSVVPSLKKKLDSLNIEQLCELERQLESISNKDLYVSRLKTMIAEKIIEMKLKDQ